MVYTYNIQYDKRGPRLGQVKASLEGQIKTNNTTNSLITSCLELNRIVRLREARLMSSGPMSFEILYIDKALN